MVNITVNPAGQVVSTSISPQTNTVNSALRKAADEEFFLNPCLDSQYQCGYAASFDGCKVHCELARVQRVLEEELKRTSLDRLFNKSG